MFVSDDDFSSSWFSERRVPSVASTAPYTPYALHDELQAARQEPGPHATDTALKFTPLTRSSTSVSALAIRLPLRSTSCVITRCPSVHATTYPAPLHATDGRDCDESFAK